MFYIQSALDIVHLYTFCIIYNKDWYEDLNRGYLFALRHNLRRWKLDTHREIYWHSAETYSILLAEELWYVPTFRVNMTPLVIFRVTTARSPISHFSAAESYHLQIKNQSTNSTQQRRWEANSRSASQETANTSILTRGRHWSLSWVEGNILRPIYLKPILKSCHLLLYLFSSHFPSDYHNKTLNASAPTRPTCPAHLIIIIIIIKFPIM
jgi:hypothetical protein